MSPFRLRVIIPGLLVSLVLAGTISLATAPNAHACSCVVPPPPQEALEMSEEVFSGEVVEISEIPGGVSVGFSVSEEWKGVDQREIEVATSGGEASCGFSFEVGGEYLVYTSENTSSPGPDTRTGLCSRTADLANAGKDLDALGAGTAGSDLQPAGASGEDGGDGESLGTSAWLLGGGATLLAFVLMALRFLRR